MRFTKLKSNGTDKYCVDDNKIEDAIHKLAVFENMCDEFIRDMTSIPERLEKLRAEKKDKTVAYRELVAQKLINTNILMFFKKHHIYIDEN